MSETRGVLTLFVKAGRDGKSLGACHQSQKMLMIAELKVAARVLKSFRKVPVNVSRPPEEFSKLGLRLRVPALHLGNDDEPIDVADDIVMIMDSKYPGGIVQVDESEAELATRDFFSRFCFYIRDVAKDANHLDTELQKINSYLGSVSKDNGKVFLCGPQLSLIDCEVLPKLHQVRVAAFAIKGYQIPATLTFLWRYLHSAYSESAFVKSCPSDGEIVLHWLDHVGEGLSPVILKQQLHERTPHYSFTVPVVAKRVILE